MGRLAASQTCREAHAVEPWLRRADWAAGHVEDSSRSAAHSKVTRVTVEHGSVTVATSYLTAGAGRTIPAGEIAGVTPRITMQAGDQPYYDVTIVLSDGKRVSAGSGIRDKREAEWLAATVKKALGR